MAKREIYDCDRCDKQDVKCFSFCIGVGTAYNGTDRDTVTESFDLCGQCCADLLAIELNDYNLADNLSKLEKYQKWKQIKTR